MRRLCVNVIHKSFSSADASQLVVDLRILSDIVLRHCVYMLTNAYNEPHKNLSTIVHMCLLKRIQMVYIFSRFREIAMGSEARFMVIIHLHGTGRVEDIRNGFPSAIHGGVTLSLVCYFSELST